MKRANLLLLALCRRVLAVRKEMVERRCVAMFPSSVLWREDEFPRRLKVTSDACLPPKREPTACDDHDEAIHVIAERCAEECRAPRGLGGES